MKLKIYGNPRMTEHFVKWLNGMSREATVRHWKTLARAQETLMRIFSPTDRARFSHKMIDAAVTKWRKSSQCPPIPCGIGCSKCCYLAVDVTDDEAELIADLVEKGSIKIDYEPLKRQAKVKWTKDNEGWLSLPREEQRCVMLLESGLCSIYEDRPATCRKWFIAEPDDSKCDTEGQIAIAFSATAESIASAASAMSEPGRLPQKLYAVLKKRGLVE